MGNENEANVRITLLLLPGVKEEKNVVVAEK